MKTVKVQPNQNVFDLAVQHYGNVEAVDEIIANNPELVNDQTALRELGIDTVQDSAFRMDAAVKPGHALLIDETSKLMNPKVIKKITNETATYETKTSWQERLNLSKN
ncbi:MAG: hypothetical protein NC357_08225 [Bacteroides sp.]|nr:hypothetical protein [Bacteroides sp.]